MLEIRTASTADTPAIVRIVKAVYDQYEFPWDAEGYHRDLYDIEAYYSAKGHEFYLGEWEAQPAGTAALKRFETISATRVVEGLLRLQGCDCSLERLYVHPDFRRRGIGRGLFLHVADRARTLGCKRMEIWSDMGFLEAHTLYQAHGAKVVAERLCNDPNQSPEWGLVLDL